MQKEKLLGLINRYYLNKSGAESVLINFNEDETLVDFHSEDKTLLGQLSLKSGINIGDIGIFQTDVFVKLLGAFNSSDEIDITTNTNTKDTVISLNMKNKIANVLATVADPAIIEKAGSVVDTKYTWHGEYELDSKVMDLFKRYQIASEAEYFAFDVKDGKTTIIMNYSTVNTNRIHFDLKSAGDIDEPFLIAFKANAFSEIFAANKNCTGKIYVTSVGLCKIELGNEDYKCTYYLVKSNI